MIGHLPLINLNLLTILCCLTFRKDSVEQKFSELIKEKDEQIAGLMEEGILTMAMYLKHSAFV